VEKKGINAMNECSGSFAASIIEAIKDTEMRKAKRVRDVLKTTEKLVDFLEKKSLDKSVTLASLVSLKDEIESLKTDSESQGVTLLCGSLSTKLETFIAESKAKAQKAAVSPPGTADSKKSQKNTKKKRGKKK
jgi:hypothetical protein